MRKLSPKTETALVIGLGLLVVLAAAQWTIAAGQRMARARGKSGAIACVTNLRHLSLAVGEYTQDYDGVLPPMQTPQAMQTAVIPYNQFPADLVCPDTGLAYIPNAALSEQPLIKFGHNFDTIELARDAAPHEDSETAIVYLDGSIQRGGIAYNDSPNTLVVSSARQLALAVNHYEADNDQNLPPMNKQQEFEAATYPYVRSQQPFSTPTGSFFVPNPVLGGVNINTLADPANTILFQDTPPYVGGNPTIAYVDGHVIHAEPKQPLLWAKTDGTASVWNLNDAYPDQTYTLYGPYAGWTPKAIAQGPNGSTRLLWTNRDGRAALWNLADAHPDATCSVYGPYPGWTAKALAVGPDSAAHLLWDNADGRVSVWNTADADPTATCLIAGPYSGWKGQSIAVASDNAAYLLWDNVSGQVSVWDLKDLDPNASCLIFGPYTGWAGTGLTINQDNSLRLQWDNTDGRLSIWNLDDLQPDTTDRLYGPFAGWTAQPE